MRTQESGHKRPINMGRIVKAPARAISKLLDLYVKGVMNFTNAYNRPVRTKVKVAPNSHLLPRSLTTSILPDNDQPLEGPLVRSISAPGTDGRPNNVKLTNFETYLIQRHRNQMVSKKGVPSSCNVGMGKIDEDRASSFRDDNIILKGKLCIENEDSLDLKRRRIDV